MTDTQNKAPAGWYDDGTGAGTKKYWDGEQWVEGAVPPPAPPTVQPAPTATKKRNTLGLVALIVAIVGFVFACIPGALIIGWILLPIAFILSIVALFMKGGKATAITGLVLAVVGTIVAGIVFATVVVNAANDAFAGTDVEISDIPAADEDADDVEAADDTDAALGTRGNPVSLGQLISGDDFDVVVNSVNLDATADVLAANQFNDPPAEGMVYALVNMTITYTGDDSGYAMMVSPAFVTSSGQVLTQSDALVVGPDPTIGLDELYTGGSVTGNIVLQIPADADGLLRITPGILSDEVFVAIR